MDMTDESLVDVAATQALIAQIVHDAAACGAGREARALAAAIATSERAPLLAAIRRAAVQYADEQLVGHLDKLEKLQGSTVDDGAREPAVSNATVVEAVHHGAQDDGKLSSDIDPVLDAEQVRGVPDLTQEEREAIEWMRAQPSAAEPPMRFRALWGGFIDQLAARAEDGRLVEIAVRPDHAGSMTKLAELCGLRLETLSRVKNGRRQTGFTPKAREWMVAYLKRTLDDRIPAKLTFADRNGPPPKPGSIAPQIWVSADLARRVKVLTDDRQSMRLVFERAMREYIDNHPDEDLPAPPKPGTHPLRSRVDKDLLAAFDAHVGGPEARADHLRAALAESLRDVKASRRGAGELKPAAA